MLSLLPTERIVTIYPNMTKMEIENAYLESFMDKDTQNLVDTETNFNKIQHKAQIKALLRKATDQKEIDDLTAKLNSL